MATKEQITNKMNQLKEMNRLQAIARNVLYKRLVHDYTLLSNMLNDLAKIYEKEKGYPLNYSVVLDDVKTTISQLQDTEIQIDLDNIEEGD